jgi:hypothetical protein
MCCACVRRRRAHDCFCVCPHFICVRLRACTFLCNDGSVRICPTISPSQSRACRVTRACVRARPIACSFPLFESTNPGCTSTAVAEHKAVIPELPHLTAAVAAVAHGHADDGSHALAAALAGVGGDVSRALAAHMSHLVTEEVALSAISAAVPHAAQVDVFVRSAAIQGGGGAAARWLPVVLGTLCPPHAAQYVHNYDAVAAAAGAPGVWTGLVDIVAAAAAPAPAAAPSGHGGGALSSVRIADLRERVPALDAALRARGV